MSSSFPKNIEELPTEEFYAILKPVSVTIPGDERSRTNPGHGYPEHTVEHWEMETFPDKSSWESEVKRLSARTGYGSQNFKAVKITPAKVKIITEVEIES